MQEVTVKSEQHGQLIFTSETISAIVDMIEAAARKKLFPHESK
jgi:hypothetical protein